MAAQLDLNLNDDTAIIIWSNPAEPNPRCGCRYRSTKLMSWTVGHPARRFFTCPFSMKNGIKCGFFDWIDPELKGEYAHYKPILNQMRRDLNGNNHSCSERAESKMKDMQINMMEEQLLFGKHVSKLTKQVEMLSKNMKPEVLIGFVCGCGFMLLVRSVTE